MKACIAKGCGHVEEHSICFKCWLGGMRHHHHDDGGVFAEQWRTVQQKREQRLQKLEELKKQIPELAELNVMLMG